MSVINTNVKSLVAQDALQLTVASSPPQWSDFRLEAASTLQQTMLLVWVLLLV